MFEGQIPRETPLLPCFAVLCSMLAKQRCVGLNSNTGLAKSSRRPVAVGALPSPSSSKPFLVFHPSAFVVMAPLNLSLERTSPRMSRLLDMFSGLAAQLQR